MEEKFSIRLITFSNGERYPLLVNQQGQPHWYATLYATTQIRNASKAPNTIVAALSAIRILLSWSSAHNQNVEHRFRQRCFLNEHELESLRQYTQTIKANNEAPDQKVITFSRRIEKIRGNNKAAEGRVNGSTQYIRMTYIADYIEWLAINLIEQDAKQLDTNTLSAICNCSLSGYKLSGELYNPGNPSMIWLIYCHIDKECYMRPLLACHLMMVMLLLPPVRSWLKKPLPEHSLL